MRVKQTLLHSINILLSTAALGYIAYLLITYEDYALIGMHFRQADAWMWLALAGTLILMPLNQMLEASKWRYLLRDLYPMSLREAIGQVLHGLQGAFLTPGRVGDFPARVMTIPAKEVWPKAVGQGFVGSAALMAVNIIGGLGASVLIGFEWHDISAPWLIVAAIIIALAFVGIVAYFQKAGALMVLMWSLMRYLVFCTQMVLMLIFVNIDLSWHHTIMLIPIYYMCVTLLPVMPVAEGALKGSVSALVFASATHQTTLVALAAMLLWVVNTIFPMLYGMFFVKKQ